MLNLQMWKVYIKLERCISVVFWSIEILKLLLILKEGLPEVHITPGHPGRLVHSDHGRRDGCQSSTVKQRAVSIVSLTPRSLGPHLTDGGTWPYYYLEVYYLAMYYYWSVLQDSPLPWRRHLLVKCIKIIIFTVKRRFEAKDWG